LALRAFVVGDRNVAAPWACLFSYPLGEANEKTFFEGANGWSFLRFGACSHLGSRMERKFFNPWAETIVGTNRLPHWDQPGATYFATFRLADALPSNLITQWRERTGTMAFVESKAVV
jgi:hypothetical protein